MRDVAGIKKHVSRLVILPVTRDDTLQALFARFPSNVVASEMRGVIPTASDTSDTLEGF